MICPKCQNDKFETVRTNSKGDVNTRKVICKQCDTVLFTGEFPIVFREYSDVNMKANPKLVHSGNKALDIVARELFPKLLNMAQNE